MTVRSILKQNKGFTAIELLIVMLAGVILIASGGKLASTLFDNAKLSSFEQGIQALRTTIQYTYQQLNTYNGIKTEDVIGAGGAPETLVNAQRTALVSPWNTDISLSTYDSGRQFQIIVSDIPQAACLKLLNSSKGSWVSVQSGGTVTRAMTQLITSGNGYCTNETSNTITYTSK